MYSGITQSSISEKLYMSEAQYCRKENGHVKINLREARKIAKILDLDEKVIEKFWMADRIYELMKTNQPLFYESLKIVEMFYEHYDTCVEIPNKNCSFSSLEERMKNRKKK